MKILVLISTYNGEKYINEQIDSILSQDIAATDSISILVRDDGSNDNTINILESYRKSGKLDYYCGHNLKTARSFWDLLQKKDDYDFYAFCDQDDFWTSTKIKRAISLMNNKIPQLYCSSFTATDKDLNPIKGKKLLSEHFTDFYHAFIYSIAPGCTFVFNSQARDLLLMYKMDDSNNYIHDWLAHKIISCFGEIIYDSTETMLYRQHGNNVIGFRNNGLKGKIKRFLELITKRGSERSDSAREILHFYENIIDPNKKSYLMNISEYKTNKTFKRNLLKCKEIRSNKKINNLVLKMLIIFNKF